MAKLNILPRKKFEIVLDNGTVIPGQYGTWALIRFSKKRGVKLSEIADSVNAASVAEDFEVIGDYILAAIEQPFAEKGGANFPYNVANFFSWLDELGWDSLGLLINPDEEPAEEKKSEREADPLNGTISNASQEVAA